jgi:hypothetical protein
MNDRRRVIERSVVVPAPADRIWERVTTPEGINHEMLPWMTMTMPRAARELTIDTLPLDTVLGRAWMRLFGILPFDYDALSIVDLKPGRAFHERSTMASMRHWEHERTLEPLGDGSSTRVTDRLTLEPRIGVLAGVLARVVSAFFGHRHRRLAGYFGA